MKILSLFKGLTKSLVLANKRPCMQMFCMGIFLSVFVFTGTSFAAPSLTPRAASMLNNVKIRVNRELGKKGFALGQPIFVRIFKMPGILEVWMMSDNRYRLYKEYPICCYSGYPGPKLQEGDWQSPEGFYTVSARQMNPNSSYHLSFNVGYPNEFDRARRRTGSSIMVHGECSSRGCFAMGNSQMEEIYLLAHSALTYGQQRFGLHIFPFKLTARNLFKFRSSPWIGFWKKLQPGFEFFEQQHKIPDIVVKQGNYVINSKTIQVAMATPEKKENNK
jgi:murein L,D-transpeptidase YafK